MEDYLAALGSTALVHWPTTLKDMQSSSVDSKKIESRGKFWGTKCLILGEKRYFVWDTASESTKWLYIPTFPPGYAYACNDK